MTAQQQNGMPRRLLMKYLLLLCLIQHCLPFGSVGGIAGSEIRANRTPITSCFPPETRRYNSAPNGSAASASSSSSSSSSTTNNGNALDEESAAATGTAEENQLEQNTKYVKGLIETLEGLLDKYIVTGSMPTRRRAYNILQQIERLAMDENLALQAKRMAKRSGMPMDPPPPIPPTEHIPAVDQQQTYQQPTNVVNKPMGAMASNSGEGQETSSSSATSASASYEGKDRKVDANERLAWERKNRDKNEFMNKMKDNAPRSALSARLAGSSKGGDPFLNGVMESGGSNNNSGLDPFAFANDKKNLQDELKQNNHGSSSSSSNNNNDSTASSTSDIANDMQQTIATQQQPPTQPSSPHSRNTMEKASAKSSEFIARAGSGNAFLGSVLGVGGLDDVLSQIQRRVWIPLAAPPALLSELGIQPVRGLLLYGSPGCGKTLLARKLGGILSPCRPITIVSGPEILDKFVGSSEKNLREIFDNPPEIYHEYKKNYGDALAKQALHVIVLDEFDAIARRRGGSGGKGDQGDAGVARDSVVNQLLAKMDGVDGLGVPTLLVGLTNKPSLIDPALMRPGRFEVQIEVPKPRTVEQRVAILKVHTESMVKNGRVLVKDAPEGTAASKRLKNTGEEGIPSYEELLDILAVECDGMSGASLAGVARAAASRALERAVTDFAGHIASSESSGINGSNEGSSISDCLVTQEDFEKAVEDVFESAKGGDYIETDSKASNDDSDKTDG